MAEQRETPPLGFGYQPAAPWGASLPGPRLAPSSLPASARHRQRKEGKGGFADKIQRGARPAATRLAHPCVCHPWLSLSLQQVEASGSACGRVQAVQHPLPLPAAAPLGELRVCTLPACVGASGTGAGQPSESSGLTLQRASQPLSEKTWPKGAGGQGAQPEGHRSPGTRS